MAIGTWTPEGEVAQATIEPDFLQRAIDLSKADRLDDLPHQLTETEQRRYSPLVKIDRRRWEAAVADLSDDDLTHLIRFFTMAEMQLSGWEAGSDSPVIWINGVLRQRGGKLSKEMLLWIKENSDNQFIPNGAL